MRTRSPSALSRAWEQVLGWLQPTLTQQFLGLAFHEQTRRQRPELIAREAAYSNANPPHMFRAFYRCAASAEGHGHLGDVARRHWLGNMKPCILC